MNQSINFWRFRDGIDETFIGKGVDIDDEQIIIR